MDFLLLDPNVLFASLPSADNPFSAMLIIFLKGGWILFIPTTLWCAWEGWKEYIRNKYDAGVPFVLLAIDIPKGNEQSPKAVEHIFSHLYGIEKKGNLKERYVQGYTQLRISLEIVSIEGYIQFLIRAPRKFRDLVEAAIYAQYPEAEITEVEDYINSVPKPLELPHPVYDLWGTELKLTKSDVYPLKTYPFFEHSLSQKFMDPMASILEILSRMGPGEQLWLQIIIAPVPSDWREKGIALIRKLIGKKEAKKGGDYGYFPRTIATGLAESFTASIVPPSEMEGPQAKRQEREWPSMMQHLSPDERGIVEAIGMKIARLGFKSKIRLIYWARRDIMNKPKGVEAVVGALQQFSTQDLNGIKVNKKTRTKIDYFFIKQRVLARQRRILWGYRYRSMKRGRKGYILNTEELATLWHFPIIDVKVPAVQTVSAKKAQAPITLPVESVFMPTGRPGPTVKGAPPTNLPTLP